MAPLVRRYSESQLANSHPLDVLHNINPEIASVVYADNNGLISPEMRRMLPVFRHIQSRERVEMIRGAVAKYGWDSRVEIEHTAQNGMTARTQIVQDGMTKRTGIEADTMLEVQKMKYELGRAVSQDHLEGQKYLSDNQLIATAYEAKAAAESLALAETLRAGTARSISRDKMQAMIFESEKKYAALIRQAEIARDISRGDNRKEVAMTYIAEQARINRMLIEKQIARDANLAKMAVKYYDTMGAIGKAGAQVMKDTGSKSFKFRGDGTFGKLNVEMDLE